MARRVVVTGMGAVSPLGHSARASWEACKAGKHGFAPITHFDAAAFEVKLAAEVKGFDAGEKLGKKDARRMDRYTQFGCCAAAEAIADSAIDLDGEDRTRFAVVFSAGVGGLSTIEEEHSKLLSRGPGAINPFFVPMMIINMAAGQIAIRHGAKGHCASVATACASSAHAIGDAMRLIKHGDADFAIAGGAEAIITPLAVGGFAALQALSKSADPDRASIPFDAERSGFVMGEGGCALFLESLDHALARGARIYAEIRGYGSSCDAYHMTSPEPGGEGAARAMRLAMAEGGIEPADVSYVNAHGTSTAANDKFETQAIKAALGERAAAVPVSSTKSMTGHMLGAAGAIEAMFCAFAIGEGLVPPTVGWKVADPECDLDCVPNAARKADVRHCLSNSLGFGGHNASLLVSEYEA